MGCLDRRTKSMLSLCQRAGKLVTGDDTVLAGIKNGSAFLVLIAADASDNTIKKFTDKCSYYEVPFKVVSDKEELGNCIGKYNRAVFAVTDEGFAKQIAAGVSD
jgi:ribosomal protein L7Ae-like RNA K-turn-binding protein